MSMDLDEILQVFFEETDDHLNTLETLLSELRPSNVSDATVNAILRAAHSIKGNSATCGLSQVSKVAHEMESLLDVVRQRQGALNASAVRLLLEGKDLLSAQLEAYRSGMEFPEDSVADMCHRLEAIKKTLPPYGSVVSDVDDAPTAAPAPAAPTMQPALSAKEKLEKLLSNNERTLQIIFVLDSSSFPVENVFQAMAEFGEYTIIDTRTPKNQGYHEKKVLYHVNLTTLAPEKEIRDTLGFVVDDEESILIDVIQGPNDDHFGLFDVVFSEEDHAKPHVHALDAFPPLPVGPMDIEIPQAIAAPAETPAIAEVIPALNEVEEDDPWGMDSLARPEEKLAAIDIDGMQPARAASSASAPAATVVAQAPVVQSAPAPAPRTKQEDDADELFRELAALDIPAPAPEMLSFPELSAITLPGMEPSTPTAQLPTPVVPAPTLPVAKPSVDVAPGMTAGPTYVLDHPLTKTDYLKTPVVAPPNVKTFATPSLVKTPSTGSRQFQRAADRKEAAADAVSLRVNLQKVESVVDLVGELVIAQNQLQQATQGLDPVAHAHVFDSLAEVTEHTKALQEAVLSIRMTPMSTVFNRFYRMVRELNLKLGKHVVMKTMGENTEMDKILVEKLVDPLAHIVRNSMDHGIETTADRIAAGKPEQGYILLRAFHRANAIIIEIMDDGRGMHRDKILQKAEEKGLLKKDPAEMSDSEVWNLIFEPGFSTAAVVTDVSGRGVGMDVVKQNILDLNGRIDIFSAYGKGMKITLTLPLTLSIMDGMFINVSSESFVVPMSNLVQTMTPDERQLQEMKGFGPVLNVEGRLLPVVKMQELFDLPPSSVKYSDGVWLILESGDSRVVAWVDKLEGQQQVVLKSLERNYKKSSGIFGATIRNDGTVALIVEPADVIEMAASAQQEQWVYSREGAQ